MTILAINLGKTPHTCEPGSFVKVERFASNQPPSIIRTRTSEEVCQKQGLTSEPSDYETAMQRTEPDSQENTAQVEIELAKNKSSVHFISHIHGQKLSSLLENR